MSLRLVQNCSLCSHISGVRLLRSAAHTRRIRRRIYGGTCLHANQIATGVSTYPVGFEYCRYRCITIDHAA